MDGGKEAGLFVAPGAGDGDAEVFEILPLLLQQQNDIDAGTAAYGSQHQLHWAHTGVVAADGFGAVGFNGEAIFVGGLEVEGVV